MNEIDVKVLELLEITDEFLFPAYYSHEDKVMWKISNVFTDYNSETLVLCPVTDGISLALDLAITEISKRRDLYYGRQKEEASL